jgi:hypothetical protein
LEAVDGRLTGRYRDGDCGPEQVRHIHEHYDLAAFARIHAYGDSREDRPTLALAHKRWYRGKQPEAQVTCHAQRHKGIPAQMNASPHHYHHRHPLRHDRRRLGMLLMLSLLCAGLVGCGHSEPAPGNHYATLAEARADDLFGRGWLPDILPASTTTIRTSNNPGNNTATGEFHFAAADAPAFFAKLSTEVPTLSPFANWPEIVDEYAKREFSARSYRNGPVTWTFFCDAAAGSCDYAMWTAPSSASNAHRPQPAQ